MTILSEQSGVSEAMMPCPFCGNQPERISIGTLACRGIVGGKEIHNTISMHPSKWNNRAMTTAAPGQEIVGMLVEALEDARNAVARLVDESPYRDELIAKYDTALEAARK